MNTGRIGGNGGDGGARIAFTGDGTLNNSVSIAGGNGGAGGTGTGGAGVGSPGAGGAGVVGASLTIINSGTISGGLSGDGITRANAITFTGGSNVLTLNGGSLVGNIDVTGSLTFNQAAPATLSNAITGTGSIVQAGPGALTLSGANTYNGTTTVNATLIGGAANSFSAASATTVKIGSFWGYGRDPAPAGHGDGGGARSGHLPAESVTTGAQPPRFREVAATPRQPAPCTAQRPQHVAC